MTYTTASAEQSSCFHCRHLIRVAHRQEGGDSNVALRENAETNLSHETFLMSTDSVLSTQTHIIIRSIIASLITASSHLRQLPIAYRLFDLQNLTRQYHFTSYL